MLNRRKAKSPRGSAAILLWYVMAAPANAAAPNLSSDTEVATAGNFQLSWDIPSTSAVSAEFVPVFELQVAHNSRFTDANVLYEGPDTATVISGLGDGRYFYRLRARIDDKVSGWSEPLNVTVEHHSLAKAFAFFIAGAVVFLATTSVIVSSSRKVSQQQRQPRRDDK